MSRRSEFSRTQALLVCDEPVTAGRLTKLLSANGQRQIVVRNLTSAQFQQQPEVLEASDILLLAAMQGLDELVNRLPRRRPVLVLTEGSGFEVSHAVMDWLCSGRFMVLPARNVDPDTIVKAVFTLCRASLRVLLVDDDPDDQQFIEEALRPCPVYNVELVSLCKPTKIRETLARQPFDLVLLDFHLKAEKNGLEWARTLQNEGCEVPIIILSGQSALKLTVSAGNVLARGKAMFLSKNDLNTERLTQAIMETRSRSLLRK